MDASFRHCSTRNDHALPPVPAQAEPPKVPPAFYRLRDVTRISALSRSTVYRRISEGRFPAPVHLGGRASAWSSAELQAWINDPEGYRTATPQP
ncbi:MAG: AlpA family phage regulatory protein [Alcaligenaceae bacterium]|nr:MAG: AlpA family phage regulatory protein [Alcaligenaceae bacterium]